MYQMANVIFSSVLLANQSSFYLQFTFFKRQSMQQLLMYEVESVTWDQTLKRAVCISLCANNLGESMNLSLLPATLDK